MEARDILWRIQGEYSRDEIILFLRHYISVLKQQIGMLEGELQEEKDFNEKLRGSRKQKMREWLEEEAFEEIRKKLERAFQDAEQQRKNAEDWQVLYFRLLNNTRPG